MLQYFPVTSRCFRVLPVFTWFIQNMLSNQPLEEHASRWGRERSEKDIYFSRRMAIPGWNTIDQPPYILRTCILKLRTEVRTSVSWRSQYHHDGGLGGVAGSACTTGACVSCPAVEVPAADVGRDILFAIFDRTILMYMICIWFIFLCV